MKDFYYILGTERHCTTEELSSAYHKLVEKLRPDGSDQDHFLDGHLREITEAYTTLSDPARRRKYDSAFKRNQQRRIYFFKIRYLNVAVTLTLIVFTGLFGFYVMKAIKGKSPLRKPVVVQAATAEPVERPVIRKKKHSELIAANVVSQKPFLTSSRDTVNTKVIAPAKTPPVAPVIVQKPIPVYQPAEDQSNLNSTYTTYLKANVTGVISLHEQASYRSNILASIPDKANVTVLEKGPGFYKVSFNGQTGYVSKGTVVDP